MFTYFHSAPKFNAAGVTADFYRKPAPSLIDLLRAAFRQPRSSQNSDVEADGAYIWGL